MVALSKIVFIAESQLVTYQYSCDRSPVSFHLCAACNLLDTTAGESDILLLITNELSHSCFLSYQFHTNTRTLFGVVTIK